jgi:hypothetical protein
MPSVAMIETYPRRWAQANDWRSAQWIFRIDDPDCPLVTSAS